jgi:long-chain-fatty-acid---luciferin-component ligase
VVICSGNNGCDRGIFRKTKLELFDSLRCWESCSATGRDSQLVSESTTRDMHSRVKRLHQTLPDLVVPRHEWSPVDESLYGPVDFYRVPLDEAHAMQLKAIKYAFKRHYDHNKFYHKYCREKNIGPDNIKTNDDLAKIPLIPDLTFKRSPSGKDFAYWLATVFTGEVPNIFIESADPTLDETINAFEVAGIKVLHSSGTSGMMTFIPKDVNTMNRACYECAKSGINLNDFFVDHALMCFPNPAKASLAISSEIDVTAKLAKQAHYLFDFEMSAGMMQRAMSRSKKAAGTSGSSPQNDMQQQTIARIVHCLERLSKTEETFVLVGAPFMLLDMMHGLQKEGRSFDFGERGLISTGGGWRINENARIPLADFTKHVQDVLGIPETHCNDGYSSTELNEVLLQCPEGHYRHLPHTHLKAFVLGEDLTPLDYGESGRFAFLDALAHSYPGFFITSDQVRMLEQCPVCDRPGPVLDPEIQRTKGAEIRGCAETLRRTIVGTLTSEEKRAE